MSIKSLLYLNNCIISFKKKSLLLALLFFISFIGSSQQIANYINNGSFEITYPCSGFNSINVPKYWRSIDSSTFSGVLYFGSCFSNVPSNTYGYQVARTGTGYGLTDFLCQPPQCSSTSNRGYYRNRLKSTLINGKIYCVKFYVNIGSNSTYGIDGFGAYFSDNTIDTISKISIPLTYINPQIQNTIGNIITDTLNWSLITGTFVAAGTEKFCVIGNFKSDANTSKVLINPTNLPKIASTVLIDDVSCIPIDLPAYAGSDIYGIPTNTVYIGRQRDVGIDEACLWYHLPNTTTAIDTAAGITVTVTTITNTYMVKQDICGMIKYDTVVVYASAVGLNELKNINENFKIYPNPANEIITIELNNFQEQNFQLKLYNNLNQLIREEDIIFKDKVVLIKTDNLKNGIYFLNLSTDKLGSVSRKFVVSH